MAMTIELYEEHGSVTDGHGASRVLVQNWEFRSADSTQPFIYFPITRPQLIDPNTFSASFTTYHFFKISGTYGACNMPTITIIGALAPPAFQPYSTTLRGVRMYAGLTDSYVAPNNTIDTGLNFVARGMINSETTAPGTVFNVTMVPKLSLTGPNTGGVLLEQLSADTTYYTQYIKSQLLFEGVPSDIANPNGTLTFGNLVPLNVTLNVDERE